MSNPRKPTELKLVQGTFRPDRVVNNEVKPKRGIPNPPKHMSTEAKKYWKKISVDLDNIGVLTIVDETALEILCETYSEWRAACESLKSYGSPTFETVTKDGSIMFRNRPEVAVKADTERRMKAMLTEFGLTPASRTKVAGRDDNGTENRFAKFGNKTDGSSR